MNNTKKILITSAIVIASICILITGVFSFFSAHSISAKDIKTGSVDFSYKTLKSDNDYTITIKNQSTIPIYIRLNLDPTIIAKSDTQEGSFTTDQNITYSISSETEREWEKRTDGFYYYKEEVLPETKELTFKIENLQVSNVDNEYENNEFSVELFSNVEACQSSNNMPSKSGFLLE